MENIVELNEELQNIIYSGNSFFWHLYMFM